MLSLRPRVSLHLDQEERDALLTLIYVVRDNWWLSPLEELLLTKLEHLPEPALGPSAA